MPRKLLDTTRINDLGWFPTIKLRDGLDQHLRRGTSRTWPEPPMSDEPVQALLPGRRSMLVRLTCETGMRPAMLEMLNTYADGLAEEPGTEMFVVSLDADDDEHRVAVRDLQGRGGRERPPRRRPASRA